MQEEIVAPRDLKLQVLKPIFESALMDVTIDRDGDMVVKENGAKYGVKVDSDEGVILFTSVYGFKRSVPLYKRLDCINNINLKGVFLRAFAGPRDTLIFEYDLFVGTGISKRSIAMALKRFHDAVRNACLGTASALIE